MTNKINKEASEIKELSKCLDRQIKALKIISPLDKPLALRFISFLEKEIEEKRKQSLEHAKVVSAICRRKYRLIPNKIKINKE